MCIHAYIQVNFDKPDKDKFPLFHDLEGYKCLLEPGEVLYIPMYWWVGGEHLMYTYTREYTALYWQGESDDWHVCLEMYDYIDNIICIMSTTAFQNSNHIEGQ